MSGLDPARRFVRQTAWALSLAVIAALLHSLAVAAAFVVFARLGPFAALALQVAIAFLIVRLARLVIDLSTAVGAAAGACSALLPLAVVAAVDGPAGLLPWSDLAFKLFAVVLCAAAGGFAAKRARAKTY